uniref:Uncharacterized protein n=1 Tax=Rhizophora mucronata TaxID=61149 RepID=A0A2P2P3Z3_RHIMU
MFFFFWSLGGHRSLERGDFGGRGGLKYILCYNHTSMFLPVVQFSRRVSRLVPMKPKMCVLAYKAYKL